jgi:hypothetical protein
MASQRRTCIRVRSGANARGLRTTFGRFGRPLERCGSHLGSALVRNRAPTDPPGATGIPHSAGHPLERTPGALMGAQKALGAHNPERPVQSWAPSIRHTAHGWTVRGPTVAQGPAVTEQQRTTGTSYGAGHPLERAPGALLGAQGLRQPPAASWAPEKGLGAHNPERRVHSWAPSAGRTRSEGAEGCPDAATSERAGTRTHETGDPRAARSVCSGVNCCCLPTYWPTALSYARMDAVWASASASSDVLSPSRADVTAFFSSVWIS